MSPKQQHPLEPSNLASNLPSMKEFLELRQQVAKLEKDIEEKEVELVKLQKEIKKVKTAREDIERSRLLKQYDEQEKVDNEMRAKKAKKEKELELIKKRKRDSEARRQKSVQERLEAEQASNPQSAVLEHAADQSQSSIHTVRTMGRTWENVKGTVARTLTSSKR